MIVTNPAKRFSGGGKALVGNAGYCRYLRRKGTGKAFEIDAGKLAEEAHFDGIFVLRTNASMTPLDAVLRYRKLLLVEDLFRRAKVQPRRRPINHTRNAAIRGHVFWTACGKRPSKRTASGSPRTCRSRGTSDRSSRSTASRCRQTGANTPPDLHPLKM